MDTVFVLVGKIGMENLSTTAKKRLKTLNELEEKLIHLQNALEEASEADKGRYQAKVDDAQKYFENFEEDFRVFLDDEYTDFVEKKRVEKEGEDAKAQEKAQKEAEAQKKIDDENQKHAEEEARKKAEEDAEAERQRLASGQDPSQKPASKGIGLGTIVIGGLIAVATLGAVNYFKNK